MSNSEVHVNCEELCKQLRDWHDKGGRHGGFVVEAWEVEGLDTMVENLHKEQ